MNPPLLMVCAVPLSVLGAPVQAHAPRKAAPGKAQPQRARKLESVDSSLTLAAALSGEVIPASIRRDLTLVNVSYWSFDHRVHQGQIVIHKALAPDVRAIFRELHARRFPIARVVPIVRFHWSDKVSMAANNTSGFNYRHVPGHNSLSNHAFGRAIDINPVQNPYMQNGLATPPGAVYRPGQPGTITDGPIVQAFERRGWHWGGRWRFQTDWQHFDKSDLKEDRSGKSELPPHRGLMQQHKPELPRREGGAR